MADYNLKDLVPVIQIIAVPLLGYGAKVLQDIRRELRQMNGRITRLEEWKEGHEKFSSTIIEQFQREFNRLNRRTENNKS